MIEFNDFTFLSDEVSLISSLYFKFIVLHVYFLTFLQGVPFFRRNFCSKIKKRTNCPIFHKPRFIFDKKWRWYLLSNNIFFHFCNQKITNNQFKCSPFLKLFIAPHCYLYHLSFEALISHSTVSIDIIIQLIQGTNYPFHRISSYTCFIGHL